MKPYFRALSLLFGHDARRAIAEGQGGALGGSRSIAFTEIEIVERRQGHIARRIVPYSAEPVARIEAPRRPLRGLLLDWPRIMGIVNVTPDSFSDGGLLADAEAAIAHGVRLAEEG